MNGLHFVFKDKDIYHIIQNVLLMCMFTYLYHKNMLCIIRMNLGAPSKFIYFPEMKICNEMKMFIFSLHFLNTINLYTIFCFVYQAPFHFRSCL